MARTLCLMVATLSQNLKQYRQEAGPEGTPVGGWVDGWVPPGSTWKYIPSGQDAAGTSPAPTPPSPPASPPRPAPCPQHLSRDRQHPPCL